MPKWLGWFAAGLFATLPGAAADPSTINRDCIGRFWAAAEGRGRPVTILSFGDSMADSYRSISYVCMRTFCERLGVAGYALNNYGNQIMCQVSGGAEVGWFPGFWFTKHVRIPPGAAVQWESSPPGGVPCNHGGIFFVAQPAGGLLTLSISTNGGPWAALLTINGFAISPVGCYTNVSLALNKHRLRVESLTGTNYIIGPRVLNTDTNGLVAAFADEPGIALNNVTNVPLSIRAPVLAALDPDLLLWHMKEDGSETTRQCLLENEDWWSQSVPGMDVAYIGTPWSYQDLASNVTVEQNMLVRSIAVASRRAFVDCATPAISYTWLYGQGYMPDGTHLTLEGSTYLGSIAWNDLNFFALRRPRSLSVARSAGAVTLSFPTGTGVTYAVEQSEDLDEWLSGMMLAGDGLIHTTNVPVRNHQLFRLKLAP